MNLGLKVVLGGMGVILLGWFAFEHFDQSVDLDFGLFTISGVLLPFAIFGAVVVGMLIMVGVGLRSDLRTRQELERAAAEADDSDSSREAVLEQVDRL
jgi:uncharacterized integral membrane protein